MLKKKIKLLLLLLSIGIINSNAQNALLCGGGDAEGVGGSASYSIGQIDYISFNSTNGYISEGVQQPYIFSSLPVTMLTFQATLQDYKVILNWETATEINSSKFIVERSSNGLNFITLTEMSAAINSNILKKYSTPDFHPLPGINLYRIKEVDVDGRFFYSKVESINFGANQKFAIVYPNPSLDNITLKISTIGDRSLSYLLINMAGASVKCNKIISNQTVIQMRNLSSATYFLKILENNKELQTFKIIKTK